MTEETRKELTREILRAIEDECYLRSGWPMLCIVKELRNDKYRIVLGPGIGPKEVVHALAEIMPGLDKWNDQIEKAGEN